MRFMRALNATSMSLLVDPPLALRNNSMGMVSIAELSTLGVRLLLLGRVLRFSQIGPFGCCCCFPNTAVYDTVRLQALAACQQGAPLPLMSQ